MRMHTHGKCSPNILLGALTVFCVIVLYNYWTVSTLNHDLIIKIHGLEEQIISMSKSNDALQANLEKVEEIKEKVEGNLKKEQIVDQKAKEEINEKELKIKSLLNDLENSKQETQNCRDDLTASESKVQANVKEISDLKAKGVSLEAQLEEKKSKVKRMENELKDVQKRLAEKTLSGSSSTSKSAGKPSVDIAPHDAQPVLLSDPAVSYPSGWMEPGASLHRPKIHVSVINEGDTGIERTKEMGPVIIFDPPSLSRVKARFSVLDPPTSNSKNEMKPDAGVPSPLKQPESLNKPQQAQAQSDTNGGEDLGLGVLPIPGQQHGDQQQQQLNHAPNLDAAEDDGDRPIKDDFGLQDDQSPDGALSQKEMNAAIQAPDMKHHENAGQPLPFDNNL